ncbi:transmembrane protein, putative [Medicago truncatula]|uniref:Transmembrane protein, putative n=1 Tax=Medicago truncatula TaxID=3880 RepID=G7KT92_MEDTR|nr:transmembrane protein, putative [Medicago truncatula]
MAATRKFIYVLIINFHPSQISFIISLFVTKILSCFNNNVPFSFFFVACKTDKDCPESKYRYIFKCRSGECVKIKI